MNENNLIDMPVRSSEPFPVLTDVEYSASTVQVLKNLLYDRNSEMTATMTYLHQDWSWYPNHPEIANKLEEIAITEMTHLDVLSNAVVAFGGNADFSKDGAFWQADWVDFDLALPQTIFENIRAEEIAIENYTKAIELVSNESLKALFRKIISDEQTHIAIFKTIINDLSD